MRINSAAGCMQRPLHMHRAVDALSAATLALREHSDERTYIDGCTSFVQLWIADEEELHAVVQLDVPELLRLEGERLDDLLARGF